MRSYIKLWDKSILFCGGLAETAIRQAQYIEKSIPKVFSAWPNCWSLTKPTKGHFLQSCRNSERMPLFEEKVTQGNTVANNKKVRIKNWSKKKQFRINRGEQ